MRAIEVALNGDKVCVIGTQSTSLILVSIALDIHHRELAVLDVHSLHDLGDERQPVAFWVLGRPLAAGDVVALRFTDVERVDTPEFAECVDDSGDAAADEDDGPGAPPEIPTRRNRESCALEVSVGGLTSVATLEPDEGSLSLGFRWSRTNPDECYVSLTSFSLAEMVAGVGSKERLHQMVGMETECVTRVRG